MSDTPETTPAHPEANPEVASESTPTVVGILLDTLLQNADLPPEIQDELNAIQIELGSIEAAYGQNSQTIELDALKENIRDGQTYFSFCLDFLLSTAADQISSDIAENIDPEMVEQIGRMIPTFERALELNQKSGIAIVDHGNLVLTRASAEQFMPTFFSNALKNIGKKPIDEAEKMNRKSEAEVMLQTLFSLYPSGSTVIAPPGKGGASFLGGLDELKFKIFLASQGVKLEKTTPKNLSMAGPSPDGVIRLVMVPKDKLPKLESGWNLEVVDRFVNLMEQGKTVWQEGELFAMALTRKGLPAETALARAGVTPQTDPNYGTLLADLKTLPVLGQPESPPTNV